MPSVHPSPEDNTCRRVMRTGCALFERSAHQVVYDLGQLYVARYLNTISAWKRQGISQDSKVQEQYHKGSFTVLLCVHGAGAMGQVPLPYRSQAKPVLPSDSELHSIPEGPCRAAAIRSRMTRGLVSASNVMKHSGLGLNAYVQTTSPIRRYT